MLVPLWYYFTGTSAVLKRVFEHKKLTVSGLSSRALWSWRASGCGRFFPSVSTATLPKGILQTYCSRNYKGRKVENEKKESTRKDFYTVELSKGELHDVLAALQSHFVHYSNIIESLEDHIEDHEDQRRYDVAAENAQALDQLLNRLTAMKVAQDMEELKEEILKRACNG